GRIGRRSSTKTKTLARSISPSILVTRRRFMRICGLRDGRHGLPVALTTAPAADSTSQLTAEQRGGNLRAACPHGRKDWRAVVSGLRLAIPSEFTRWWTLLNSAGFIVPRTQEKAGRE